MKTNAQRQARLFYIVGASGSGKDSIMHRYREIAVDEDFPIVPAHRSITRANTNDEGSVHLSESEFCWRERNGLFSMSWRANGLCYGIGMEVEHWLAAGFSVLVNGSRAYLPEAKSIFGDRLHSILIDVPAELLLRRLQDRGRESAPAIEKRLERHQALSDNMRCDSVISNQSKIETAVDALKDVIDMATLQSNQNKQKY